MGGASKPFVPFHLFVSFRKRKRKKLRFVWTSARFPFLPKVCWFCPSGREEEEEDAILSKYPVAGLGWEESYRAKCWRAQNALSSITPRPPKTVRRRGSALYLPLDREKGGAGGAISRPGPLDPLTSVLSLFSIVATLSLYPASLFYSFPASFESSCPFDSMQVKPVGEADDWCRP